MFQLQMIRVFFKKGCYLLIEKGRSLQPLSFCPVVTVTPYVTTQTVNLDQEVSVPVYGKAGELLRRHLLNKKNTHLANFREGTTF